ncbi:MAG: hypothetical protein AAF984_02065 [Verrucomicrobiota bacterium]
MTDRMLYIATPCGTSYELHSKTDIYNSWKRGEIDGERLIWDEKQQGWLKTADFFARLKHTASVHLKNFTRSLGVRPKQTQAPQPQKQTMQHYQQHRPVAVPTDKSANLIPSKKSFFSSYNILIMLSPLALLIAAVLVLNYVLMPAASEKIQTNGETKVTLSVPNMINLNALQVTLSSGIPTESEFAPIIRSAAIAQPEKPVIGGEFNAVRVTYKDQTFLFPGEEWKRIAQENDPKQLPLTIGASAYYVSGRRVANDLKQKDRNQTYQNSYMRIYEYYFK